METTWYIKHTDKKVYGPYSQKQIETYLSQNKLSLDSFISPDKTHWGKIADYKKELLAQIIEGDIGNEETVAQPHVQEKKCFAHYEILGELGRGGMGVVYKARDTRINRVVALKTLLNTSATEMEVKRFVKEATANAKLKHENIVSLLDVGNTPQPYFSMEYIEGQTFKRVLIQNKTSLEDLLKIFHKICLGVDYAHKNKVIHRDIKPGNIMMNAQNEPKIMDFGLAKTPDGENLSRTGEIMGTAKYMSPEQINGRRVDKRTDIYALGVLLYEILTDEVPYNGNSIFSVVAQMASNDPIEPRYINSEISRDLNTICMKCLSKKPQNRYISANLLAKDIKNYLDNKPIIARPAGRVEKSMKWMQRNKIVTVFMLMLVLAVGIAGIAAKNAMALARRKIYASYKEGCNNLHLGEFEKAKKYFFFALKKDQNHLKGQWLLGTIYFLQRDLIKAYEHFDIAMNLLDSDKFKEKTKLLLLKTLTLADAKNASKKIKKKLIAMVHEKEGIKGRFDETIKLLFQKAENVFTAMRYEHDAFDTYLLKLSKKHMKRTIITYNMPKPGEKLTKSKALYYSVINLFPYRETKHARELLYHTGKKSSNMKNIQHEVYKVKTILENKCKWAKLILETKQKVIPSVSEMKEIVYIIHYKDKTKWIMNMGSPFWSRLHYIKQQKYALLYQKIYARLSNKSAFQIFEYSRNLKINMVFIPPGQFLMGAPFIKIYQEGPQHKVLIPEAFWIAQHEITQIQWTKVMGEDSKPWRKISRFIREADDIPVTCQDFNEIESFILKLNGLSGERYEWIDEERWEYAYRAGTTTTFYWGENSKAKFLWNSYNPVLQKIPYDNRTPTVVGKSRSNCWKIFNMADNVLEVCCSDYRVEYDLLKKILPLQNQNAILRTVRGGYFNGKTETGRATYRIGLIKNAGGNAYVGFRVIKRLGK